MLGNTILQVIMAIIVVLLLGVISYSIYNNDIRSNIYNMSVQTITKKQVPVFKGIYSYSSGKITYNTNNPEYGDYISLDPSMNQNGGAEYSYNFWLYITAESAEDTVVLFTRGSDKKVNYKSEHNCDANEESSWYLVKNPLVKLFKDLDNNHGLVIELNSLNDPDGFKLNSDKPDCNSTDKLLKNASFIGIKDMDQSYNEKWTMVTFVVQETNPTEDIIFRNKANVKIYINGILNTEKSVGNETTTSTAMLHNHGKLHINPGSSEGDSKTMIADLLYSNYALSIDEVVTLYKAKFNTNGMIMPSRNVIEDVDYKYSSKNPEDIKIKSL